MYVVPILGKLRQEDLKFEANPEIHSGRDRDSSCRACLASLRPWAQTPVEQNNKKTEPKYNKQIITSEKKVTELPCILFHEKKGFS
jgi:hypothetical protein